MNKTITLTLVALIALPACGATQPAASAGTDEMHTYLVKEWTGFGELVDDSLEMVDMLNAGDFDDAEQLAVKISDEYFDAWAAAPDTGTELSDVANDMLYQCGKAYEAAGRALEYLDVTEMQQTAPLLERCGELTDETAGLLP